MGALALHGFFEGIALGVQSEAEGVIFLGIAILAHKWAEAFTLVNIITIILFTYFRDCHSSRLVLRELYSEI